MESSFLKQLKQQTDQLHNQAHHLEYFKMMFHHTLPFECYIGQLRALSIIYGTLEREIENSNLDFPKGYVKKIPLLLNDISTLEKNQKGNIKSIKAALLTADDIMNHAIKSPSALLGYLYTLEGSLQGGNVVAPHIIKQYNLKDNLGVSYFYTYKDRLTEYWDEFKIYLEEHSKNNEEVIIEASKNCFQSLIDIYDALYPFDESKSAYHSAIFNPEAGEHAVPTDPKEIQAAINASKECWYYYPYFELRYGEKGYRFGISDTLWLLTLSKLQLDEAKDQTLWITKYLSNKGMPSIIMQMQLYFLCEKLENKKEYKIIENLYQYLQELQLSVLNQNNFKELSQKLETDLDINWVRKLKNIGDLSVSALIDTKLGFMDSKEIFFEYFCDEKTFSKEFIEQYKHSVEKLQVEFEKRVSNE